MSPNRRRSSLPTAPTAMKAAARMTGGSGKSWSSAKPKAPRLDDQAQAHQGAGQDPQSGLQATEHRLGARCRRQGRDHRGRPMARRVSRSASPVSATMPAATNAAANSAAQICTVWP